MDRRKQIMEETKQQQKQSEWRLQSGQYLGEISALCFLHLPSHLSSLPYLLAGSGSQVLLYDLEYGCMIRSFQIFQGIRVHGITWSSVNCAEGSFSTALDFEVAVFGEKVVKVLNLHFEVVLRAQNRPEVFVNLSMIHSLPMFSNWVLDVCFLKGCERFSNEECNCIAVGCSDNSVHLWDILKSSLILQVRSSEVCLLYSMRLWGHNLEALHIASGTIYNEIIVWKVVPQYGGPPLISPVEDHTNLCGSSTNCIQLSCHEYEAFHICRLSGHEGSIFRISWSSDGSKLVSVSDDRSARIWEVHAEKKNSDDPMEVVGPDSIGPVLFGHDARVWDCCISDSLIVTAGEDSKCCVWGLDGKQLRMIKEHLGRGIWRCLFDPSSLLLITAGFDSAIKVHQLYACLSGSSVDHAEVKEFIDKTEMFTVRLPNSLKHLGLMDSKSEYVRCLHFTNEDTLYVATNHGYLYHAKLSETGNVKWSELLQVSKDVPIVCMDLLLKNLPENSCGIDEWIAVGDGKGNATVVRVMTDDCPPEVNLTFTWSAGPERQLLGTYWCKSLGHRFIFTADPRGMLKLWNLCDPLPSTSHLSARTCNISLIAEFTSCFGMRIMCLDASFEEEVLVCGDLRGNLILFPLLKGLLLATPAASEAKISPLNYFKGAHGISSVSSISVARFSSKQIEIRSTGGDGCICYLEYDRDRRNLEFIGMKQVKELSLIQSVSADKNPVDGLANTNYAAGFASTDFIIWNLKTDAKVVEIPCGGWRRPHSYYMGDVPEKKNCFTYVKDEIIYIHRHCLPESERKIFPQNLHMQFHGREMHSLCFVSDDSQLGANGKPSIFPECSWIATGCEDGTVRLTRYACGVENWSASKLLGEHVGGSAVRSICSVSTVNVISSGVTNVFDRRNSENASAEDGENPFLLISVGAKRVLTSWLLRNRRLYKKEETLVEQLLNGNETGNGYTHSSGASSSMSFQWLSTDMPTKYSSTHRITDKAEKTVGEPVRVSSMKDDPKSPFFPQKGRSNSKTCLIDKYEDDWRYLAVTAFLVKCAGSRLTVCFVVVACSDATLTLRALILPHRLWFDVALLVPLSSPVLALQHVIIPIHIPEEKIQIGSAYIVISGATDGSIAFWDVTESVEAFVRRLSTLNVEKFIDCQKRPRTGRGSQGGRWWRSLTGSLPKKKTGSGSATVKANGATTCGLLDHATDGASPSIDDTKSSSKVCSQTIHPASLQSEVNTFDFSSKICEICPLHVLENVHQSGVNCLHVSTIVDSLSSVNSLLYTVISGGDDQALHCLKFDVSLLSTSFHSNVMAPDVINSLTESDSMNHLVPYNQKQIQNYKIRFLCHDRIASAHSSAVKGIWTDGTWVFSTGLDQRVRCWFLDEHGKLIEHTHLIISVPEPEALDARACGRNHYQIAVAGRGMQMVEFCTSCDVERQD